eukprot:3776491-Prymnesium_polylepis.2
MICVIGPLSVLGPARSASAQRAEALFALRSAFSASVALAESFGHDRSAMRASGRRMSHRYEPNGRYPQCAKHQNSGTALRVRTPVPGGPASKTLQI